MELMENQLKIKIPQINESLPPSNESTPNKTLYELSDSPPPPPNKFDLSDSIPPPPPIESDSIHTTLPDLEDLYFENPLDTDDTDDSNESIPPPPPKEEDKISSENNVPELNANHVPTVKFIYNEYNNVSISQFLADLICLSIICIPLIIIITPFYIVYRILRRSES